MNTQDISWPRLELLLDELQSLSESDRELRLRGLEAESPADAQVLREWLGGIAHAQATELPKALLHEGLVVGAWRLLRTLGRGGMGVVWLCERTDGAFNKKAAIKFIRGDNLALHEKLEAERGMLAQLEHPGIARLLDGGTAPDGQPYMVTEYVDGVPIDVWCREQKPDLNRRLEAFRQICGSVAYAHANLVVHLDIKPANALVDLQDRTHLLDFGISKLLRSEGDARHTTLYALTPEFAAPEQLTGAAITTSADIYGLGGLLYFLLCGQPPLETRNLPLAALVKRVCEEAPIAPSRRRDASLHSTTALAGDLDAIALKALAKAPQDRYASVGALLADVDNAIEHRPVIARHAGSLSIALRFVRRHRATVAFASVLIASLIAGLIGTLWQASIANRQRDELRQQLTERDVTLNFMLTLFGDVAPNNEAITVNDLLTRARERVLQPQASSKDQSALIELLVKIYTSRGDPKGLMDLLGPLLRTEGDTLSDETYAQMACALGSAYQSLGNTQEWRRWIDIGLQRSERMARNRNRPYAQCLSARAILDFELDRDVASTLSKFRQAVDELESIPNVLTTDARQDLIETIVNYATGLYVAGLVQESRREYQHALDIIRRIGPDETDRAVGALTGLAQVDNWLGFPLRADQAQTQAIQLIAKNGNVSQSMADQLAQAATIKNDLAEPAAALELLDRAASIFRELEVQGGLSTYIAQERARSYALLHDEQKVHEQLALISDPDGTSAESYKAEIELSYNDPDHARTALAMLIPLQANLRKQNTSGVLPLVTVQIAEAALLTGDFELAANQANEARMFFVKQQAGTDSAFIARCDVVLAQAKLRTGDRADAHALLESATRHMEISLGPKHPRTVQARAFADASGG